MRVRRLLFTVPLVVLGCGTGVSSADTSAVSSLTGSATAGQSLYTSNCASCHGTNATSGSANRPVASLAKSDSDTVIATVLSGDGEMPSFQSTLTSQQIADVVAYLKTL
jgi:mono/diheme cytochrome c family protein